MNTKAIYKSFKTVTLVLFIFICIGYFFNENVFMQDNNEYLVNSKKLEKFKDVNIKADLNDIEIIASDDYKLELKYKKDYINVKFKIENDTLIIKETKLKNDTYNLDYYKKNRNSKIKIYIPKDIILNNISVFSNISNIYFDKINSETIDLSCDTGNVNLNKCKIENLNIITSTGSISINELDSLDANFKSNMGNIYILNSVIIENLELSNNLGNTKFKGKILGNINVANNLGDIQIDIDKKEDDYNYNLKTNSGNIFINEEDKNIGFVNNNFKRKSRRIT